MADTDTLTQDQEQEPAFFPGWGGTRPKPIDVQPTGQVTGAPTGDWGAPAPPPEKVPAYFPEWQKKGGETEEEAAAVPMPVPEEKPKFDKKLFIKALAEEMYEGHAPEPEPKKKREVPQGPYVSPTGGEPTPIQYESGIAPVEHFDPIPWSKIEASPEFQAKDSDGQAAALNTWTNQMKIAGREEAIRQGNDPQDYINSVNNFSLEKMREIKPLWGEGLDRTVAAAGLEAGSNIGGGIAMALNPQVDNSDIGKMSIDQAKHERDENDMRKDAYQERSDEALDFIKNFPTYRARALQDKNYKMRPGEIPQAIQDVRSNKLLDMRQKALDDYINSDGQVVPQKPVGVETAENLDATVAKIEKRNKLNDESYIRAHPLVKKGVDVVANYAPYIVSEAVLGPFAPIADVAMASGDSFKTGYMAGEAKLKELENQGEYLTKDEQEQFKLDNGAQQAWGTGSFMAASGFLLGRAVKGYDGLSTTEKSLYQSKLKDMLIHGAQETGVQAGLQGAQQITSNLIEAGSDSDDHKTPWNQGLGEAIVTGAIFGAAGTGMRLARTGIDHLNTESDIRFKADQVKKLAQTMMDVQDTELSSKLSDTPITNRQALIMALENKVPPEMRDAVWARIHLDEAAQDQKNTANKIRAQNPQTAQALDEQSAQTQATSTTRTMSQADRVAQRKAEMDAAAAAAAKTKEGEEEKTPVITLGAKEVETTPTPTTPTEEEKPGGITVEQPPTHEETVKAQDLEDRAVAHQEEIKGKIQQLADLTGKSVNEIAQDYVNIVNGSDDRDIHKEDRRYYRQMLHELEMLPKSKQEMNAPEYTERAWEKNTPEELDKAYGHFSTHLGNEITGAQTEQAAAKAREEAAAKAVLPPTEAEKAEAMVLPPALITDAINTNDPTKLIEALNKGQKSGPLTEDEQDKLYDLLQKQGPGTVNLLQEDDQGNYFLAKEAAAKEVAPLTSAPKLLPNTPEWVAKNVDAFPEAPHEKAYLESAAKYLYGDAAVNLLGKGYYHAQSKQLVQLPEQHAGDVQSAAMRTYQAELRQYAKAMADAGVADQIKPDPRDETTPKEAPDGTKLPNPETHLKSQGLNLFRQLIRRSEQSLEAKEEGRKAIEEKVGTPAEVEEALQTAVEEKKPGETATAITQPEIVQTPEEKDAQADAQFGGVEAKQAGLDAEKALEETYAKTNNPKRYNRAVWHYLLNAGLIEKDDIPPGTKSFKGLSENDRRIAAAEVERILTERHPLRKRSAREIAADLRREQVTPGTPGGGETPAGEPTVTAPPAEHVLQQPPVPGPEAGRPTEVAGGGEPGRAEEGERVVGQPEQLLRPGEGGGPGGGPGGPAGPPAGGATGGGVEAAPEAVEGRGAAPGGEREGGVRGPGGATTPARERERVGEISAKRPEETGGPNPTAGGGASGIQPVGGGIAGLTIRHDEPNQSWYVEQNGQPIARYNSEEAARNFIASEAPPAAPAAPREQIPRIKISNTTSKDLIIGIEKAAKIYPEVAERLVATEKDPRITDLSTGLRDQLKHLSLVDKFGLLQDWAQEFNKEIPAYQAVKGEAPEALNWEAADKLAAAIRANPDDNRIVLLKGLNSAEVVMKIQQLLGGTSTERQINNSINSLLQQLGAEQPPNPPGGAGGSGTLHSMVPGVQAMHGFSGAATDLVDYLRNHTGNTDLQEFARSLNAFKERLTGMPVRQLNNPTGVMFFHHGELWVSNAAVHDPQGQAAMAHSLQHAIAQRQIEQPQTPEEKQSFQRLQDLHNKFKRSLSADLRDHLENELAPEFDRFKASGYKEMDTRFMTDEQKNWLPVLWAAHSPENFVTAAFSNGNFRHYLDSVRMGDGRTFLEGTRQWARQIFGDQAMRYADAAHPFSANHPGMPTRFDPNVHNLEGAYPMTPSEQAAKARTQKYGLAKGVHEALSQVAKLSENPRYQMLAKELAKIVQKYPEIGIALDQRIGGFAGGYNFLHDEVDINPHLEDAGIEHSIIHEVTHALTQGKIDAYQKGLNNLLTPADQQHIAELEEVRRAALRDRSTPQVIRDIASLDTYKQREQAMLELLQRDPELGNKFYGLTDLREFASEVLSNGDLQDHLAKMPAKEAPHANMLHRAFNWVRRLLGFGEDTALGKAFNATMSLASDGRRVMNADIHTGKLRVRSSMVMRENQLARNHLEARAQGEGYTAGALSVPKDKLRQWLTEFREGNAFSQNARDLAEPHMTASPRTDAMIRSTPQLERMTRPADVLDHLARVTGTDHHDTEALREIVDRAFQDKAISLQQYIQAHQGLNSLDDSTLNLLSVSKALGGSEEDRDSLRSNITRWFKKFQYWSEGPKELTDLLLQYNKYEPQATASKVLSRLRELERAVKKDFKVPYDKLDPKVNEDILKVARMEMNPPAGWSNELVDAIYAMRNDVDDNSQHIGMKQMVNKDKLLAIRSNIGKYFSTSYDIFDDPRWRFRPESEKYRAAAESAVDKWLTGSNRTEYAKYRAEEARNNVLRRATDPTDPVAKADARKAYLAERARAMKDTGKNFLDYKLDDWEQRARNKQTHFLQYGHAYNLNDAIMTELKYLPPEVHQLMGKYGPGADIPIHDKMGNVIGHRQTQSMGDFRRIYEKTMERQDKFINANLIADGMYKLGRQNGWLSPTKTPTCSVQLPEDFDHLGKIRGSFVSPEVAAVLTDYHQNLIQFKTNLFAHGIRTLEGGARYFGTIGNLPRSMGNFHTTYMQPMINGYYFQGPALKALGKGWKEAGRVWMTDLMNMDDPARQKQLEYYIRLGLGDKETNIHEMMNFVRRQAQLGQVPADVQEALSNYYQKFKHLPAVENIPIDRMKEWLTKLHTTGPFMSKIIQFHMQEALERWFNEEDVAKGGRKLTDDEIAQKAAQEVRDTNISYSQVSPHIMAARRNPVFGTFMTFGEQQAKAWLNNVIHGWKNLRSDNTRRKWNGAARLGGAMTSLLAPILLQQLSMKMFGVTQKDDENFRQFLSPWERFNALLYMPMGDKKRAYMNLGYTNQASTIYQVANALFRPNNPDGILGSAVDATAELFKPVYSFGLFTGPMIDVARNQTEYGTQVYNPDMPLWDKSLSVLGYLVSHELGGTINHIASGRAYAWNDKVTPGGAVNNWLTGPLPEISGLSFHEISFPDRFRSILYSSKNQIDRTQQIFTGPIQKSNANLTDDKIAQLYQTSEAARRNAFRDLHDKINAARFGGMSNTEIRNALKARRYPAGVVDDLMSGRYHPFIPSQTELSTARKNGNHVSSTLFSRQATRYEEPEEEEE